MTTGQAPEAAFFFWHEMALYVGPVVPSDPHHHYGVELTLSLDGTLDAGVARGAQCDSLGGVLIGSNVQHQHRLHGRRMAQLTVGPLTAPGLALRAGLGRRSAGFLPIAAIEPFRAELDALAGSGDVNRARAVARSLIEQFSPAFPVSEADDRVLATINRLLGEFARNGPVAELAREAGLSESRLSHLFRRVVGLPVRTYRRWLRLRAGMVLGLAGWGLADAAHEAGFADQADFSRSCREAFGLPPSRITQRPTTVALGPVKATCSLMSSVAAMLAARASERTHSPRG